MYTQYEVDELIRKAIRQDREFLVQIIRSLPDLDPTTKQGWIENPLVVAGVLNKFAPPTQAMASVSTIIHVDRSIRPVYSDFVEKVMTPNLDYTGPATYDILKDISLWRHEKQKGRGAEVSARIIFNHLQENGIESCGNLQDALAIQKLGVAIFKKAFGKNYIYFWKSVVQFHSGMLEVPRLFVDGNRVVQDFVSLAVNCGIDDLTLRFAK